MLLWMLHGHQVERRAFPRRSVMDFTCTLLWPWLHCYYYGNERFCMTTFQLGNLEVLEIVQTAVTILVLI
eukprot:m.310704 g.310704  ORF g.310704 m.310704 type:complete len:70 (+) comp53937_c0_seq1:1932-2141(+)